MHSHPLCAEMQFSAGRVRELLEFLRIGPGDESNLEAIHTLLEGELDALVQEFYAVVREQEHLRHYLGGAGTVARLETAMRHYLATLGQSVGDLDYFEERLRIGFVHEGIGLSMQWYLGMYPFLFGWIARRLAQRCAADAARLAELLASLQKVIALDGLLAVETYHRASNKRLEDVLCEQYLVEQDLRVSTTHDSLTGILNRESVLEAIEVEFLRSRRFHHDVSLLIIDLDDFKSINDRFGHPFGDHVLSDVARLIASTLRPGDLVGRYGGDEILVGLPGCSLQDAMRIAERVRLKASLARIEHGGISASVTLSIGAAASTPAMRSSEQLLECADRALYAAKAAGRNRSRAARPGCDATTGPQGPDQSSASADD
ncbi:MAG: diguanylate cyclase [Planctomycetes bacterium]|nr:diguanylate cyclase [Planctomycetota bacterium]